MDQDRQKTSGDNDAIAEAAHAVVEHQQHLAEQGVKAESDSEAAPVNEAPAEPAAESGGGRAAARKVDSGPARRGPLRTAGRQNARGARKARRQAEAPASSVRAAGASEGTGTGGAEAGPGPARPESVWEQETRFSAAQTPEMPFAPWLGLWQASAMLPWQMFQFGQQMAVTATEQWMRQLWSVGRPTGGRSDKQ